MKLERALDVLDATIQGVELLHTFLTKHVDGADDHGAIAMVKAVVKSLADGLDDKVEPNDIVARLAALKQAIADKNAEKDAKLAAKFPDEEPTT